MKTEMKSRSNTLPSMEWERKNIPITEVVDALGLERRGRMFRCWRPDNHRAGDRTPSVGIDLKRNKVKGFVCEKKGQLSTIDLVVSVTGCTLSQAAKWLAKKWKKVPRVKMTITVNKWGTTKHAYMLYKPIRRKRQSTPNIEALACSPGWADMPSSVKVLAVTLLSYVDPEELTLTIGRRQLGELAGIRMPATVTKAVREIEAIGLFVADKAKPSPWTRRPTTYRLTWHSLRFQQWLRLGYSVTPLESTAPPSATSITGSTFDTWPTQNPASSNAKTVDQAPTVEIEKEK